MSAERPDGAAYIDIQHTSNTLQQSEILSDTESVGSSVEESSSSPVAPPLWSSSDDPASDGASAEDDSDDSAVEYEDWELADGDFTKQYNRARQTQVAGCSSTVPLPSRNANTSRSTFLTTNPKVTINDRDKSDRATQEQVLDPRTRLVLAGLTNRGIIGKLERCISTGKEANVYYSIGETPLAVKIYRTSILNFRSRQVYIEGEHRFRGEYSSSRNPRKMIRVWAEKELRNLRRLAQGGINTPRVFECKENVLVMEFLGENGIASPRLKDANMENAAIVYAEMLVAMRRMYQDCKLVHADLSEYNVLYHDGHPYIIDVSQSVEQDHPKSLEFLRNDIRNVKNFFSQHTSRLLSLRRMWDFIVDESVSGKPGGESEERLIKTAIHWADEAPGHDEDDAVFMSSFIPRSLAEVYDPERDADIVAAGNGDQLIYAGLTSGRAGFAEPIAQSIVDEVEEPGSIEGSGSAHPRGFRHENREAKKERKKAVKDEQRERRKSKMRKGEKQKLIKKSSGKR